jgi:hypothetical protein
MKDGVESLKSHGCSDEALLAVSSKEAPIASLLSFVHTVTEEDNHPKGSDTLEESALEEDSEEGEMEFDDAKDDEQASICIGNTKAGPINHESSDEEYEFEE